jgi:hypothetical protein
MKLRRDRAKKGSDSPPLPPPTNAVRARIIAGVRAGWIIQRRSRQRWVTSETASRPLTAVERIELLALLSSGEVRYAPAVTDTGSVSTRSSRRPNPLDAGATCRRLESTSR